MKNLRKKCTLPFKIIEYVLQDASEKKKLISIRWKLIPKMPEIFYFWKKKS